MLRRTAIAAALATVFAAPAAAEKLGAPAMPDEACATYLLNGTDDRECARSVRHWAGIYAQEQEDYIIAEQGNKPLPSLRELSYLGDIRASCAPVRGMFNDATLTESVLAADQCLRRAYEYGQIGKTNVAGIVRVGETLREVGLALKARALPSPQQACAEYVSTGKGGKECAASIAQATVDVVNDIAAHAGPTANGLVASCKSLGQGGDRMPVGYVAAMALKCLEEGRRIAQLSGYKDEAKIDGLRAVIADVALASIGKPKPRDVPNAPDVK